MSHSVYALFDSELGQCGIVWRESEPDGTILVTGFQLPEASTHLAETRIRKKWEAKKALNIPVLIRGLIQRIKQHLKGKPQDFRDIELDLTGLSLFAREIYRAACNIPSGQTTTYGKLAEVAGRPGAARTVGQAMGRNPIPLLIPCHRVLAAGNKPGGFSAHGGLTTKEKMLEIEGVMFGRPAVIRSQKELTVAAARFSKQDPRLAHLLSQPIDLKLKHKEQPYHTLTEAVIHQQLSPKAAKTILNRVAALYNHKGLPEPEEILKTEDSRLRTAGLSRAKVKSLKDIAARALDGTIPSAKEIQQLSNEQLIDRLTSIYGIGRWTVEMMLIFNLGRIDVLPVDDYALRTAIAKTLGMKSVPTPAEVRKIGNIWKPYRTIASLCLWQAKVGE